MRPCQKPDATWDAVLALLPADRLETAFLSFLTAVYLLVPDSDYTYCYSKEHQRSWKKKMVVKFYHHPLSPPARAVHFTLKSLNVPYESIVLDLMQKEHKSEEFMKINPEGSVPTIDDDGFIIVDSHAINIYLVNKYGKDDKLYPKDIREQSKLNHILFLDASELFATSKRTVKSFVVGNVGNVYTRTDQMIESFENAYDMVEKLLGKSQYICGNNWTIADFSVVSTITSMNEIVPLSKEKFPLLTAYLELCAKSLPYYAEVNETGIEEFKKYLEWRNFRPNK